MPDYDIALKGQQPNAMKSISEMLNFATGAQNFQRGNIALQKESELLRPDIEKGKAESLTAETGAKRAATALQHEQFRLQGDQAARAMTIAGGLFKDPRIQSKDPNAQIEAISEARDQMVAAGVDKSTAEWYASQLTSKSHQPGAVYQTLQNIVQANAGAQTQAGVLNAPVTPVGTGGNITAMQLQPGAPGGVQPGATTPVTLGPAQREETTINPVTQSPMVTKKNPQGQVTEVSQPPMSAAVPNLRPGEAQEIPVRTQQRVAVNQAAAKVPEQRFNNRQIMALAPQAFTGTGGDQLTKIGSAVGIQMLPGDHAGNMQRLGHFMALQAQANAQAMGAGTDAARSISELATGSTKWTPEAIISTAKVNDALSTGVGLFNTGMEAAIKKNGGNVLAVRDFQNAWSQNFDPQAVMLHNAIQSKDQKEIDKIVKDVGGRGSAGAHNLAAKLKNMETLIKDGGL